MAAFTEIDNAGAYQSTVLYSYASSPNAITGAGFAPDFVALKSISGTSGGNNWYIADTVGGNTKTTRWNDNTGYATTTDSILSFDSDGYTLGADSTANCNATGTNYVGYQWKAGTTSGIATDGNTDITPSSYSFDQTAGISILKYAGGGGVELLAHGLGAVPAFGLFKVTNTTDDWTVYHHSIPNTKYMELNTAQATITSSDRWNDTTPDSVNFTLGGAGGTNGSGNDYIAYCFAEKQGYSKFGSYKGNADATHGPFIYTGFRPGWVMIKITAISAWTTMDNKRPGYNPEGEEGTYSIPNTSAAEYSNLGLHFNCNGFKIYDNDSEWNHSGGGFIYAAFAESPLCNSNGVPSNAR